MHSKLKAILGCFLAAALPSLNAEGSPISAYSNVDFELSVTVPDSGMCKIYQRDTPQPYATFAECLGQPPFQLFRTDLRGKVSLAISRASGPVVKIPYEKVFSGSNTVGPLVEWRMDDAGGEPYALIVRVTNVTPNSGNPQVVTVARLKGNSMCLVKSFPAASTPHVNEAARNFADSDELLSAPCLLLP